MVYLFVNKRWVKLLVDSGAAISTIRSEVINSQLVKNQNQIKLVDATGHTIPSLGVIEAYVGPNSTNSKCTHKFVVCDSTLQVEASGLLGRDFLHANGGILNFQEHTLQLWGQVIPMFYLNEQVQFMCDSKKGYEYYKHNNQSTINNFK